MRIFMLKFILFFIFSFSVNASVLPTLPYIATDGNFAARSYDSNVITFPTNTDYLINSSNLKLEFATTNSGYSLLVDSYQTVYSKVSFVSPLSPTSPYRTQNTLFNNSTSESVVMTNQNYSLIANFDSNNKFDPIGSKLTITGDFTLNGETKQGIIYEADLTGFGYSHWTHNAIGFETTIHQGGVTDAIFNSTHNNGDISSVYLYGAGGAFNFIANALDAGDLSTIVRTYYNGPYISSLTSLSTSPAPVPLPAVVWTFLTGLLGILVIQKRVRGI